MFWLALPLAAMLAIMHRSSPVRKPIPKNEGWRYGELISRAMHEHKGGKWEAVSDRDKDTVWYPTGYRFAELLASLKSE